MMRILFYWLILISFSFSLEVHDALFPRGEELKQFTVNDGFIGDALFFNNGNSFVTIAIGDESGSRMNFFDIDKKRVIFKLKDFDVDNCRISNKKGYFVYVHYKDIESIKLFDIENKKIFQTVKLDSSISSLDISQNGKYLVYATRDNKIHFFDIEKSKLISTFSTKTSISRIRLSSSNRYIVSEEEKNIIIYDSKNFQKLHTFKINEKNYWNRIEISDNEKYILYISNNNTLIVWDIQKNKIILKLKNIGDAVFSNNSEMVIYGEKNSLKVWNINKNEYSNLITVPNSNFKDIYNITISKDDRKVLINNHLLFNLKTLKLVNLLKLFHFDRNYIYKEMFIKKINSVFSIDYGNGIKVWNLEKNRLDYIIEKNKKIEDMVVSSNKNYLVFSTKKSLKTWDIKEKEIIKEYQEENSTIKNVAISDNGKYIAFKTENKIKIFDFNSWKLLTKIEKIYSDIYSLKFLENKYLIIGTYNTLKVFDIHSKKLVNDIKEEERTHLGLHNNLNYYQKTFYSKNYDDKKKEIRDILNNTLLYSNFEKNEYIDDIIGNKVYISNVDTNESYIWDLKEKKRIDKIKNEDNSLYAISTDSESIGIFYLDENRTEKKIKEIFYTNNYWAIADYQTKKLYRYSDKNFILDATTYQPLLPKLSQVSNNDLEIFFDKKDIEFINNEDTILNLQIKNISDHTIYWIEPVINNKDFTFESNSIIKLKPHEIQNIKLSIFYNKKIVKSIEKDLRLKIKVANNDFKSYSFPVTVKKEKEVEVRIIRNDIKLVNNDTSTFEIQLKNLTNRKLYDFEILINDENYTMDSNETIILSPHEEKKIQVLLKYNNFVTKTFQQRLNFKMKISNKLIGVYKLNLEVESRPEIEIVDIKLGSDFIIKIKNLTNKIVNNIQILVSDGNETVKHIPIGTVNIEANSIKEIELYRSKNFGYRWNGYDLDINISADNIKPHIFHQHIEYSLLSILPLFITLVLPLLIILFYTPYALYLGKFNFNVNKIMEEADKIFDMPLYKLPYYKKFLKRRMDKYYYELYFGYLLENDLERVSKFFEINSEEKAKIISEKVSEKINKMDDKFFELILNKNFEIKVKKILLYFPQEINIDKIYKTLENRQSEGILVIAKNEKEQLALSESSRLYELRNVIIPLPRNLKIFLLQKNHSLLLSKILSLKLNRKIISPYKTKNGVKNKSYFFGRKKILFDITERELSNYLIVGARQIGKTSILLALERIFKSKNELEVIYMTLSSNSSIRKIASKLNMDKNSTLEEIEEHISNSQKPYLFLVDEVDGFIKKEGQDSYKILDTFRSLTQEGKAYFIMAGFWELYYQATYDYQSPIKNFGEIIIVDKLEDEACLNLLLQPMSALNLNFKNQDDIVFVINSLGKRANLIATVANEIIENLDPFKFEISSNDIQNALNSRKVIDSCKSWQKLTNDKFKTYIDKLIIYHTINLDSFTIRKIINLFKKIGVEKVTIDEIKESLDRLELSYILAKEGRSYFYTIPWFQKHLQREDIKAILDEITDEFKRKYNKKGKN